MGKKKLFGWVALLMACCMLCAACGREAGGSDRETVQTVAYQNDDFGYEIQIPENWRMESEDDKSQVYAVSDDNKLSLNLVCELGGFNYYTPQNLAKTIAEKMTASFTDTSIVSEQNLGKFANSYRVVMNGKNEEGIHTVVDVSLLQPLEGIHYYLIFSGGVEDYQVFLPQWKKMLDSFKTTKTAEQMYQKLITK